jgi:hypothetical protein
MLPSFSWFILNKQSGFRHELTQILAEFDLLKQTLIFKRKYRR